MRVAFFEDESAANFAPIALLRPVFELVCGRFSLRERIVRRFDVSDWGAFVRPDLARCYAEEQPEAAVNDTAWLKRGTTLLLNGRWLPSRESMEQIRGDEVGLVDGAITYLTLVPEEADLFDGLHFGDAAARLAKGRRAVDAGGKLVRYPWELVDHNAVQLREDFRSLAEKGDRSIFPRGRRDESETPGGKMDQSPAQVAILGPPDDVAIDPTAQIDPFVVLDARHGPISIGAGAVIQPFTRIEGPCHVGCGSRLFRANVREGTTIGPNCRVGGEIEASILHGFVNKYHDGFLGHGYVCPWVNLGALTTNSDLKNDYSHVRMPVGGEIIDTGSTKVGCFIGDHTKTALGSLFNTGSTIGVMCMVLPGGELLPKSVPSFSRIWHGVPDDGLDLETALETARTAMGRRNVQLTEAQEELLRHLHEQTQPERDAAIRRFREKVASRDATPL
jgi:UDP-N-acetylglucosamine diphosphorylase/glucosamine-1-phosphate N-acetyltransferase